MGKIKLLPHNKEAYNKIQQSISNGDKKLAVSHATGTGKSYLIAKLCEDYNEDKKLVLVPLRHIQEEIKSLLEENNVKNVDVKMYQSLIKMSDDEICDMNYKIVALDEYHHDTAKVWGYKVRTLIDSHPETIFFGTSATPVRTDGANVIDELFDGNCVSNLSLAKAIAKGILPCPKYVASFYTLDERFSELRSKIEKSTNSKEEKDEFYNIINTMRSQVEKAYGMPIILNNHIKEKEGRYIVFCKNKTHLEEIKDTVIDWFKIAGFKGINSYVVYSSYKNKDKEYEEFCNDNSHNVKLLFCINMLNEGSHKADVSGALLLRTTNSYITLLQQIGRALESGKTNNPVIIDAVNNFIYVKDGIKLLNDIKEAINEEKKNNKDFDESKFIDIDTFFVTENVQKIEDLLNDIESQIFYDGKSWTQEEDDIMRKHYKDEGTKVSLRLKRSKYSCVHRAKILGLNKEPSYTNDEIEKFKKLYLEHGLNCVDFFPGKNKANMRYLAHKLQIKKNNGYGWSDDEKKIIEEKYPELGTECVKYLPNKSKEAIKGYARKMGIKKEKRNKFKYVFYDSKNKKYRVAFKINGKMYYFGSYNNEDEAGKVAIEKAKEYGKMI